MNSGVLKRLLVKNQTHIIFWVLFWSSIVFLALPFIRSSFGAVSLISLVPFWLFLEFSAVRSSARQRLLFIWLIGLGSMLGILYWSVQTMPERWAYIHGWAATTSLFLNYFLFAAVFSLNFLLFGYFSLKLKVDLHKKSALLTLPALWVACELLRSWLFSIITYGKGGNIGAYWNFGTLGLGLAGTNLGFAARLIGLSGLTFLAVLISLAIVWVMRTRNYRLLLLVLAVSIFLADLGYKLYQPNTTSESRKVAFVQTPPNFEGGAVRDHFLKQAFNSAQTETGIDVLVLPEYSDLFDHAHDQNFLRSLNHLMSANGLVVTSRLESRPGKLSNQLRIYTSKAEAVFTHEKSFLIPVGEYMPYLHQGLLTLMGQRAALDLNKENRATIQDSQPIPAADINHLMLGAQICSGAVTPSLYQYQAHQGAQILTNSASLSMFSQAPTYQVQSRQFAQFIAVANARPFVQAAEGGYGYILDANGHSKAASSALGYYFGSASVESTKHITIYALFGEWVAWLCTIGVVGALVLSIKSKRANDKHK